MLSEFLLVAIQIGVGPKSCKVVAVDDDALVSRFVAKAAWRSCTGDKADGLKSVSIAELPDVPCVTAPIRTLDQSTNTFWGQAQFLRRVHKEIVSWIAIEVGFSDVYKTDSQGLALPGSLGREL